MSNVKVTARKSSDRQIIAPYGKFGSLNTMAMSEFRSEAWK